MTTFYAYPSSTSIVTKISDGLLELTRSFRGTFGAANASIYRTKFLAEWQKLPPGQGRPPPQRKFSTSIRSLWD